MPLPDQIEIVPLTAPIHAEITIPGSKSITNRALILAALADGPTVLTGALWSEDTQVMMDSLGRLGIQVTIEPDPQETSNRTITVAGRSGNLQPGGTAERPLELFVGNAGTAARFLTALLCLGHGVYRLSGIPRMHERPQGALLEAVRQLGYRVDSSNNKLPALIYGNGPQAGACQVGIAESSQFASALLLCAGRAGWKVEIVGKNAEELPYVEMTRQLLREFPHSGGTFKVEADASSGSYFVAADWLITTQGRQKRAPTGPPERSQRAASDSVLVKAWPVSGWQVDANFPKYLPLPDQLSRARDLGDSIMTAIVLAPLAERPVRFTDLGPMRVQECERVAALRTELTRCGIKVLEEDDSLTVFPSSGHGAAIETYDDHRIAMCFAILGLKVPGIKLLNPACVKKTFPNFFQKLAAAPPSGLGATIVDAGTGQRLQSHELFAT